MKLRLFPISFLFAAASFAQAPPQNSAAAKHPFTFEDMMALKRLSEPVPSPDGKWVVFAAEDVDLEANTKKSHLWIVPASGGESRRLNQTPNEEERPRFSPDGKRLIWTSKATDPTQIWMCDFDSTSGGLASKPHQVTNISTGAEGAVWSPDGKNIVFISKVYPDAKNDTENKQRDEELKKSKVKAKIFTKLFYRHWNAYTEFKRSHLFAISADADSSQPNSARDLTPGNHDVPPFNLGGQDMYAISPDGQELAYRSNIEEIEATSTNNEIFIVPMAGPAVAGKKISTSPGADSTPLYSPDGKYLAWRSQARADFEADKWRLIIYDRASRKLRDLTDNFDRSVGSFTWCWGSNEKVKSLLFTAEDHGFSPVFLVDSDGKPPEEIRNAQKPLYVDDLVWDWKGNLYFTEMSATTPNEIAVIGMFEDASYRKLTQMNDALLSQIDMQSLGPFTFKGANNDEVEGFLIKPPGFDPNKKYPLKFLIHGGRKARGEIRGRIVGTRSCSRPTATWW